MKAGARAYLVTSARPLGVLVIVDDQDRIVDGAPYVRRFVGQHLGRLRAWLEARDGRVIIYRLAD
jgi:hypothetical protein